MPETIPVEGKMPVDRDRYRRQSLRLYGYDYRRTGRYFVTICTHGRKFLFGDVADGRMRLNHFGIAVRQCWGEIPRHFVYVRLGAFVVMRNHIHGIVGFDRHCDASRRGKGCLAPTSAGKVRTIAEFGNPIAGSLGTVVGSFKSAATRRINMVRETPGAPVWQRNYYERVIRNERAHRSIRAYIRNNPAQWMRDRNSPEDLG